MQQDSTFFSTLQNASEYGFCNRFQKTIDGKLISKSSPFLIYTFNEVIVVQSIDCPTDKSTVHLFKTPEGLKSVFVDYWEQRIIF